MESHLGVTPPKTTADSLTPGPEVQQDQLRATIRFLGNLLGETIIEQEGQELFALEEEFRALAKAWRAGDEAVRDLINQSTARLIEEPARTLAVLKAFTTYFQLVNLAEEQTARAHHSRTKACR